jgi:hypothetical protein
MKDLPNLFFDERRDELMANRAFGDTMREKRFFDEREGMH